jgi:hypothetical protein
MSWVVFLKKSYKEKMIDFELDMNQKVQKINENGGSISVLILI